MRPLHMIIMGKRPAQLNLWESYVVPTENPPLVLQRLSYDPYTIFRLQSLKENHNRSYTNKNFMNTI